MSRILALVLASVAATSPASAQRGDAFDTPLRSPEEQQRLFHVPPGFAVQLVAAEPEIQKPMNVAFDAAGRVWVTGSSLYPWPARHDALGELIPVFQKNWDDNNLAFRATSTPPEPAEHGTDTLRVLSDFDPATGRARKVTIFADGLNIPIGVLPLPALSPPNGPALSSSNGPRTPDAKGDTALVFSIPAIWRLTDTDGDGRADRREKLYDGFGFKDTHGMSSSYWLWLDGWVYGTHGFANTSSVTDRSGRVTKLTSGNTYRFRPDGSRFELFAHGQTNPFGLAFDARGNVYTADSHSKPVYLLIPGGYYEGISREHDGLGFAPAITTNDHGSSAIAGIAHYSATHFPREFQDTLFNGNPVTRRINRARLDWRGSTPHAARQSDFLTSDDPAFRPIQVKLGPDGALWVADFYNPIIGHYEVPLTHPARDRSHGRLWRIVWRGLDGSVAAPTLPNLSNLNTIDLVKHSADPNLVTRCLAVSELLARSDAASAAPALHAAASRLVNGTDPTADETAASPLLFALERLGRADDALLRQALQRPDSAVALAALRVLATRECLPPDAEHLFHQVIGRVGAPAIAPHATVPGHTWRAIAEILIRRPQPWGGPLLLAMLTQIAPSDRQETKPALADADSELVYALRLALKTQALAVDTATLRTWAAINPERVADICVAVPTPAAAHFLLEHLERTAFASERAGEFARHAVMHLPADEIAAVLPLLHSLASASLSQRVALAEGFATLARSRPTEEHDTPESLPRIANGSNADEPPPRALPDTVQSWMQRELLAALDEDDSALLLRAINALKPLAFEAKAAPLARIALQSSMRDSTRTAALRALPPNTTVTDETAARILTGTGSNSLRRAAAEVLGTAKASSVARSALVDAFSTASADLALTLATSLAKSDEGAAALLDLAAGGRIKPTLLNHRHVTAAFEKRPAPLRTRAADLTRDLPPEDARLDAVIAQRLAAASSIKPNAVRGVTVFTQHCAACHRFANTGGNLGPSLDGISSRSIARLVEDILDPSRNIDPAFRLHTVTLKNGETRPGLNPRETDGRTRLTDPSSGTELSFARNEIAEITPSTISAMPAAFDTLLSEQDLFDLLEHLRAPK